MERYELKERRKDGMWEIAWREGGHSKRKSIGTRDYGEAIEKAPAIIAELKKPQRPETVTVETACKAYMEDRLPHVASPASIEHALAPIIKRLGSLQLTELSDAAVRDYADWRMKQPRKNANVQRLKKAGEPIPTISAGTVIRELNNLRPALAWAYRNGWVDREIKIKSPVKAPPPRERWLTKAEAKKLVDVGCKGYPHIELFILIALQTAARMTAILELKWDQVHLPKSEDGRPVIGTGGLKESGYIDFGQGSGNKRRGRVPLGNNPRLFFALVASDMGAETDYVIEYRGKRVKNIKKGIAAAARRAGLEGVSAHTLKHTSISWLVQAGHSFECIAKITATSAAVIEQIYGHHSPDFLNAVGRDLSI